MAQSLAGAATEEITPDDSVPLSGYGARETPSSGVRDPLLITSLVLSDGATTVGIVAADLLNVSRSIVGRVKRRLVENGVFLDEIIVAASHTHSGPYVPAPILDIHPTLGVDDDVDHIVDLIVDAVTCSVRRAYDQLEPASIRVGEAKNCTASINRRTANGDGGGVHFSRTHPDETVTVVDVVTVSGEEIILYNFACHPVCTSPDNTLLSADWPGEVRKYVSDAVDDATVLFINGAAGDINPRPPDSATEPTLDTYIRGVGEEVAEAVLSAHDDARSKDAVIEAPLITDRRELRMPIKRTPPVETLRDALDAVTRDVEELEEAGEDRLATRREHERKYVRDLLSIAEWGAETTPAPLPYIEIGPVGLLGVPGEPLVGHGLRIRQQATASHMLIAGYANHYIGYIPILRELENFGYEVWTTKISPRAIVQFRDATAAIVREH